MTLLLDGKSILLKKPPASSKEKLQSGKAGLRAV